MMDKAISNKRIKNALISVFYKEPAKNLIEELHKNGVTIYSTGGTLDYIKKLGIEAESIENLTGYPSIFGGRVKTLHPKVFGGILARSEKEEDRAQLKEFEIPEFDLVVVDLYPFEETLKSDAAHQEIIEKIDIGGISLIRAAAKNYKNCCIVPSQEYFDEITEIIKKQNAETSIEQRKYFAGAAFNVSSHYDTAIFSYFNEDSEFDVFKHSILNSKTLRYGENPHQWGKFYGNYDDIFKQLNGKELSYNNILDIDAAFSLMSEFTEPSFAIIKHSNACGMASRATIEEAWEAALASDPVSAFGGILFANRNITEKNAYQINELFFEVIIAPDFEKEALNILCSKKNRIILQLNKASYPAKLFRTALNGVLCQKRDDTMTPPDQWQMITKQKPDSKQIEDLLFANKLVKHTKSNAIVLVKDKQLIGSGTGQTSRVDALMHAIAKAKEHGHNTEGAVMASDAFFPFPDCVEIADKEGIKSVIQPGGSLKDNLSIEYCNNNNLSMVFTGTRHFKH
ncbi:MAG: bifunctional phosphoribosylaminoimidazolecarboxamide formyltransferase/IMP cyclohydrolase [Bacteroidota bacterium]